MVSFPLIHSSHGLALTDAPERPGLDTYLPECTTDFGVPENVMLALEQLSIARTFRLPC